MIKIPPVPLSSVNLCRYAAYLGRSHKFASIQQYLNVIRILHLEMGVQNPLKDNWMLRSVMQGIKRGKGAEQSFKLPLSINDLQKFREYLSPHLQEDSRLWAVILCCFFGLLRIGNVTVRSKASLSTQPFLRRSDFHICNKGSLLHVRVSKTIQNKERVLEVPLPFLSGNALCPTSAVVKFLALTKGLPSDWPLFALKDKKGQMIVLTQATVRRQVDNLVSRCGLPSCKYGTHSLRRGGATWLMLSGVPLSMIKCIGDWKSDAVERYMKPTLSDKMDTINLAALQYSS